MVRQLVGNTDWLAVPGLSSSFVRKLFVSRDGNLWVGTDRGAAYLQSNATTTQAANQDATRKQSNDQGELVGRFKMLATEQGKVMQGSVTSFAEDEQGRICRGTGDVSKPVGASNATTNNAASLTLAPAQRNFTIEFSALDYAEPKKTRYQYRLQGYEKDWINTDADHHSAAYGNLWPGSYTLQVRGTNRMGDWSVHELNQSNNALNVSNGALNEAIEALNESNARLVLSVETLRQLGDIGREITATRAAELIALFQTISVNAASDRPVDVELATYLPEVATLLTSTLGEDTCVEIRLKKTDPRGEASQ